MVSYRNSRTGGVSRSSRAQVDNDTVVEGLPIRQWGKAPVRINNSLLREPGKVSKEEGEWPELPMPKDSHLYEPYTQHLLRLARRGRTVRLTPQPVEEDKLPGDDEDAEGEPDSDYVFTKWQPLPQQLEESIPNYLAPRRKGLPPMYGSNTAVGDILAPMRKTKIRKADSEGNEAILEVLVPEGQAVEGEIVEDEAKPSEILRPGTVVEGVGVVNAEGVVVAADQAQATPLRRRPPPPKRKAKGPGRGRKKKVMFGRNAHMAGGGQTTNGITTNGGAATPGGTVDLSVQDHEINGALMLHDGEEGSEEDDEGDEVDEDREDGELSPDPASPSKSPKAEGRPPEARKHNAPSELLPMQIDVQEDRGSSPLSSPDIPLAEQNLTRRAEQTIFNTKLQEPFNQQDQSTNIAEEHDQNVTGPKDNEQGQEHGREADQEQNHGQIPERTQIQSQEHNQERDQEKEQGQRQEQEQEREKSGQQEQNSNEDKERQALLDVVENPQTEKLDEEALDTPKQLKVTHSTDSNPSLSMEQTTGGIQASLTQTPPTLAGVPPPQAELPGRSDPLDGLAEPKAPGPAAETAKDVFPEEEEDLLGSLERTLDVP